MDQYDQAIIGLEKVLEIEPGYAPAKEVLSQIEEAIKNQ